MSKRRPLEKDWDDLENEEIDPLDLDELLDEPIKLEKNPQYQRPEWVLQYKDKQYLCPLKFKNLGFFIHWIMNWRRKQGYRNESFTWIKCSEDENEVFDYSKKNLGCWSKEVFLKRRFDLEYFMADVVYRRVRPLSEKVIIGKKKPSKKKNYYVTVGKEKIGLCERSKAELYQAYKEFVKNFLVTFFCANDDEPLCETYFSRYDKNCKSEAAYNGGREIVFLIKESLKRQEIL